MNRNAKNITCKHIVKKVQPFADFEKYWQYREHSQKCYATNRQTEQFNDLYLYVDSLNGNTEELKATIKRYEESTMYYRDNNVSRETYELKSELHRLERGEERIVWDFSDIDRNKELDWRLNINLKGWEL